MGKPFTRLISGVVAGVAAGGLSLCCLATGEVSAQTPASTGPTRPPVVEVALIDALRGLAAQLPLDVRLDPLAAQIPVKVDLSGVAPELALDRMLPEAGVDFAIGPVGDRILVVVGSRTRARPLAPEEPRALANPAESAPAPDLRGREVSMGDEVEEVDEDAAASRPGAEPLRAPGEMSPEEILRVFTPSRTVEKEKARWVELPFPGEDGGPLRVWREGDAPGSSEPPPVELQHARPPGRSDSRVTD